MNYPDLREGDFLPMVGVLQHLLNRTGASLVPDGVFGRRTLAAVRAFQTPRGLLPDGVVGEKTWARLTRGLNLPILDSVDITDPTFLSEDAAYVRRAGGDPLLIGGMCNGVEQTIAMLKGYRDVFLVRFHGHGAPGVAGVASGQGEVDPKMQERSDIWANPVILNIISRLRPIFGPYGCVQFIQCETGRGNQGRRLLSQLATTLGVPVTGAVLDQPFGRLWSFRLSGPTVTVVPGGGSLSDWCKFLPHFPGMTVA
jgi:hypothetical protein